MITYNNSINSIIEQLNNNYSCSCLAEHPPIVESKITIWCNILIPSISVLVLIIGWFINTRLRQKEAILKKQLKYRMSTINSCIDFLFLVADNSIPANVKDYSAKMTTAKRNLFYYGTTQENELFDSLLLQLDNGVERDLVLGTVSKLQDILKNSVRKSLKLS